MYKTVVDSLIAELQTGFNEALMSRLGEYGITAPEMQLRWSGDGVAFGKFESQDFGLSLLTGRLVLAITPAGTEYTGTTPGIKWSGIAHIGLNYKIRYSIRSGDEVAPDETELTWIAAAVEQATVDVLCQRTARQRLGMAVFPSCPTGPIPDRDLDGLSILVPIQTSFHVDQQF